MDMLAILQQTPPQEWSAMMTALYTKNRNFFCQNHPAIDTLIESVDCPYQFEIDDNGLHIIHTPSLTRVYGQHNLFEIAEQLATASQSNHLHLTNFTQPYPKDSPLHCAIRKKFERAMEEAFPGLRHPETLDGESLSRVRLEEVIAPPMVFAGLFHGLHIGRFLAHSSVSRILLIEPDSSRFEVSCYFVDYEALATRFQGLPLNIGPQIDAHLMSWFHSGDKVTSRVWMRVLPGYESETLPQIVEQLSLQQKMYNEIVTSVDQDLAGITNGFNNLAGHALLTTIPRLKKGAKIAIVASGPSLGNNLQWLQKNQQKLIIFAVHSSVKVLKEQGIRPDFQFALDTHLTEQGVAKLQLDHDIPLVVYYKSSVPLLEAVKTPLLVVERDMPNCVNFPIMLTATHPSTANLALSFGLSCSPEALYLFGLDLGYRDAARQYVEGTYHKKSPEDSVAEIDADPQVAANFRANGPVFTRPFWNQVRLTLEQAIAQKRGRTSVWNCSDGAFIQGALPQECSTIRFGSSKLKVKKAHLRTLEGAFRTAEAGKNWDYYPETGDDLLAEFVGNIEKTLALNDADVLSRTAAFDVVLHTAIEHCKTRSYCLRMVVYMRLLVDLLATLYGYIAQSSDRQMAEMISKRGVDEFVRSMQQLQWPEGIDTPQS